MYLHSRRMFLADAAQAWSRFRSDQAEHPESRQLPSTLHCCDCLQPRTPPRETSVMAGNFNLQRILGNMPGMAGNLQEIQEAFMSAIGLPNTRGGGQQPQEDASLTDTAEQASGQAVMGMFAQLSQVVGLHLLVGLAATCLQL